MDAETIARVQERITAARRMAAGDAFSADALTTLLDVAEAAARYREAETRAFEHPSSVERMDAMGETKRHRDALDAALARLAGGE